MGGDSNLFRPHVSFDHEDYRCDTFKHQYQYQFFAPWPCKMDRETSSEAIATIVQIMDEIPHPHNMPFHLVRDEEVYAKVKGSVCKVMKLD